MPGVVTRRTCLGSLSIALWLSWLALAGCAKNRGPIAKPSIGRLAAKAPPTDSETDLALLAARRLLPGPFGLPAGTEAIADPIHGALYTPITERIQDLPPSECLNLLGQPSIIDGGFNALADTGDEMGSYRFTAITPLVFRDRRAGYILAIPSGAKGDLPHVAQNYGEDGETSDGPDYSGALYFDRLVIIDPKGGHSENRALLSFSEDGLLQVCPYDPKRKASECSEEPLPDDPGRLPYRYDVTRCAKGCEKWCPSGVTELDPCDHPPAPICVGESLRLFFNGQDIGERCQYEEWDLKCTQACQSNRCDAQSPVIAWSVPAPSEGSSSILLTPNTPGVITDGKIIAYSPKGQMIWQEDLSEGYSFTPVAADDGGVVTLSGAGEVRKIRGKSPWLTKLEGKFSNVGGLALSHALVYVARGTKLIALDAQSGQMRGSAELGAAAYAAPVVSRGGSVVVTTEKELVILEAFGKVRWHLPLAAKPTGPPAFTNAEEFAVATQDGKVLFGGIGALRPIAAYTDPIWIQPAITPDSGLLVVTQHGGYEGSCTLHKLSLPSGRELWKRALGSDVRGPVLDSSGNLWLTDDTDLVAISAAGRKLWTLDLRGNANSSPPLLGPDGTLYLRSSGRLTALSMSSGPK